MCSFPFSAKSSRKTVTMQTHSVILKQRSWSSNVHTRSHHITSHNIIYSQFSPLIPLYITNTEVERDIPPPLVHLSCHAFSKVPNLAVLFYGTLLPSLLVMKFQSLHSRALALRDNDELQGAPCPLGNRQVGASQGTRSS